MAVLELVIVLVVLGALDVPDVLGVIVGGVDSEYAKDEIDPEAGP